MVRIQNDDLPLARAGQTNPKPGTQQTRNTYDANTLPKSFGDLVGNRIVSTHEGSHYFGCIVAYARNDEFQVEALVQRYFNDPNYNPNIRLRTSGTVVLTMKYEGRTDGIDKFALKGLQIRTWTVGVNDHGEIIRHKEQCPSYGIGIFGITEETLWNDYRTFCRIADAATVEAKTSWPRPEERTQAGGPTIPCGCG